MHASARSAPRVEEAYPAGQAAHADEVCPGAALNVPRGHGRHAASLREPATLLYRPAGHGLHLVDAELGA
jgi:hypothetical protein